MKTKRIIYYLLFLPALFFFSCRNETEFNAPQFDSESYLLNSTKINNHIKDKVNGIYSVEGDVFQLSSSVAVKCTEEYVTIFSGKNIDYFLLKSGIVDQNIVFEGHWRVAESLSSGLSRFKIDYDKGGAALLRGEDPDITINGWYMVENQQKQITLKKTGPLKDDSSFYIIAHRAGGRNSDYLSISENSLPMIEISEAFGANSIEIDIRLTKDKIPILYHDEELNSRLIKGEFCIGPVENFPFSHLRTFCRLLNGEEIPTLSEALDVIIKKTKLKLVWLDIKSPETIDYVIPIIDKYQKNAKSAGKKVSFVIGISSDEMRDKYLSNTDFKQYPALCELSADETLTMGAGFWAPRWTLGTQVSGIHQMHQENRKVFTWTMDDRQFINKYLRESSFDGILTNFPAIVAYEFYFKQ